MDIKNIYWFYGDPSTSEPKKKELLIDAIITHFKKNYLFVSDMSVTALKTNLDAMDLTSSRTEGLYIIDNSCKCFFMKEKDSIPPIMNLIKDGGNEIIADIATSDDVIKKINEIEVILDEKFHAYQEYKSKMDSVNAEISMLKKYLELEKLRLSRIDLKDPVAKIGDYVAVKSPYNGTKVIYRISDVTLYKYSYTWSYRGAKLSANYGYTENINEKDIVEVINSHPLYNQNDKVTYKDVDYKVSMVRWSFEDKCWRYKLSTTGSFKSNCWVLESEIAK